MMNDDEEPPRVFTPEEELFRALIPVAVFLLGYLIVRTAAYFGVGYID